MTKRVVAVSTSHTWIPDIDGIARDVEDDVSSRRDVNRMQPDPSRWSETISPAFAPAAER
jgi:hypothetical protein